MKVGVAGCGTMGLPMARAMLAAGLDVTGFDVRPASAFGDFAPRMVADPATFAADREVIVTVVRDAPQTEAVLFDDQALLAKAPALRYLVVSSTLSPRYYATLADRMPAGVTLVDAPMSGAEVAAIEARLAFMLGGPEMALDDLDPLFRAMGKAIHRMGPTGAGMAAKVLNNFVCACAVSGVRRVLDWAPALGVDEGRLLALMHDSSGQTWFGSNYDRIEFAPLGCAPDNSLGILRKDVASMLDALDEAARPGLPETILETIAALQPRQ